jgi:hypothetical protein
MLNERPGPTLRTDALKHSDSSELELVTIDMGISMKNLNQRPKLLK